MKTVRYLKEDGYHFARQSKRRPVIMTMHDKELFFKSRQLCAIYFGLKLSTLAGYINNKKTTKDGYIFRNAEPDEIYDFKYDSLFGAYVKMSKRRLTINKIIK